MKRFTALLLSVLMLVSLLPLAALADEPAADTKEDVASSMDKLTDELNQKLEEDKATIGKDESADSEYPWGGLTDPEFKDYVFDSENAAFLKKLLTKTGSNENKAFRARVRSIEDNITRKAVQDFLDRLISGEEDDDDFFPDELEIEPNSSLEFTPEEALEELKENYIEKSKAVLSIESCAHSSLIYIQESQATCLDDGYRPHWYCETCGKLFEDEKTEKELTEEDIYIAAYGHHYDENHICARCFSSEPEYTVDSGKLDETVYWTVVGNKLIIAGSGPVPNYSITLNNYNLLDSIREIELYSGISSIGKRAFQEFILRIYIFLGK